MTAENSSNQGPVDDLRREGFAAHSRFNTAKAKVRKNKTAPAADFCIKNQF
jgi:hypothetical protein